MRRSAGNRKQVLAPDRRLLQSVGRSRKHRPAPRQWVQDARDLVGVAATAMVGTGVPVPTTEKSGDRRADIRSYEGGRGLGPEIELPFDEVTH